MTIRPDGTVQCNRCGRVLGGDGVLYSAVVTTVREVSEYLRLNLCHDYEDGEGKIVTGCDKLVLTPDALAAWGGKL